jgi:hypothetical protein
MYDIHREIGNLYKEAADLNRKIGRLESALLTGTALPDYQPLDMVSLAERLCTTLENTDGPSHI